MSNREHLRDLAYLSDDLRIKLSPAGNRLSNSQDSVDILV
jgi:hypothetical protein